MLDIYVLLNIQKKLIICNIYVYCLKYKIKLSLLLYKYEKLYDIHKY